MLSWSLVGVKGLMSIKQFLDVSLKEKIGIGSTSNLQIYIFLYSHHWSAWYCIDIFRRNSVLVKLELRIKQLCHQRQGNILKWLLSQLHLWVTGHIWIKFTSLSIFALSTCTTGIGGKLWQKTAKVIQNCCIS